MVENSNFSDAIRNSFGKVFQKPLPEILQAQLFACLEEEQLLSENEEINNTENPLKTAFEQEFKNNAPGMVWAEIASELDKVPDTDFQDTIKNSFFQIHQQPIPVDFWTEIAENIEAEPPSLANDNLIKDSFEQKFGKPAPDYIWNAVREQINIDKVWLRIAHALDIMQHRDLWLGRLRRWMSYAALLALMHACLPTHLMGDLRLDIEEELPAAPMVNLPNQEENYRTQIPVVPAPKASEVPKLEKYSPNNSRKEEQPLVQVEKPVLKKENPAIVENDHPTDKKEVRQNGLVKPESPLLTAVEQKDTQKEPNADFKLNPAESPIIPIVQDNNPEMKDPVVKEIAISPVETNAKDKENSPETAVKEMLVETENPIAPIVEDPKETVVIEDNSMAMENINLSDTEIEPLSLSKIETKETLKPDSSIFNFVLELPKKRKKALEETEPLYRNQIGIIASSGIGLTLNEETKMGFDATSLVSTSLSPAISLGFSGTYAFNQRSAFSYELYANSQIRQELHYYSKSGRYNQQENELNYVRLAAMYQHRLFRYGRTSGIQSQVLAKGGAYAAYLRTQRAFQNKVLSGDMPDYRKLDFGLQLTLGQSHRLNRIVLEYGVTGNMGLYNIFDGASQLANLQVQNTRIVHAGGYLSLRYMF